MSAPDVLGAVVLSLPSSLFGTHGVYVGDQPIPPDAVYPHCRIFIVAERSPGSRRGRDSSVLTTAAVADEQHVYNDGDERTLLDYTDVASLGTVTASAYVGTPPLVEDRDYKLGDSGASLAPTFDSIEWLEGASVLPADGATITVDYSRNVVAQSHHIVSTYMVRAVIHAKGDASGPAASQAQRLGFDLRAWLEAMAGSDIQPVPGAHAITLERPTSPGRPSPSDRALSASTWSIDFPVITGGEADLGTVNRVRKMVPAIDVET